jgi:hypothetical protein
MLLLCVIALLTVLVILRFPHRNRENSTSSAPDKITSSNFTAIETASQESSAIITTASNQNEDLYIVKEYKGQIGVFHEGDKHPCEVIDIDISIFPEEDQKRLVDGIQVSGIAELTSVIEDYEG